jgi:hypothetical protein
MIVAQLDVMLWEAGVNPALPRNCKRGQRKRSLGKPGKADCSRRMLGSCPHPYSQSQETGVNRPLQPFRVIKETCHAVLSSIRECFFSVGHLSRV